MENPSSVSLMGIAAMRCTIGQQRQPNNARAKSTGARVKSCEVPSDAARPSEGWNSKLT